MSFPYNFSCLDASSGYVMSSPESVSCLVVACCVLHNIAIRNGQELDLPEEILPEINDEQEGEDDEDRIYNRDRMYIHGLRARQDIVDRFFNNPR